MEMIFLPRQKLARDAAEGTTREGHSGAERRNANHAALLLPKTLVPSVHGGVSGLHLIF